MLRPKLPRDDEPFFYVRIPVDKHLSKKNSRPIMVNKKTGRRFLGKSSDQKSQEQWLYIHISAAKRKFRQTFPYTRRVAACFRFIFKDFYRQDGEQRRNLQDLSNLIQGPEDALQEAGIIENDSQIYSLDGSRRLPGDENVVEIWLWDEKHDQRGGDCKD